jgi:hypothetical protein
VAGGLVSLQFREFLVYIDLVLMISRLPHQCFPSLELSPFLLKEEETYEPPKDPDCGEYLVTFHLNRNISFIFLGLSLEELGMRALERLPRDRAIDGIHAFNAMRYVDFARLSQTIDLKFTETIS